MKTLQDKLPHKLTLSGAYMMVDMRTREVETVEELLEELQRLLDLSPISEVLVTSAHSTGQ